MPAAGLVVLDGLDPKYELQLMRMFADQWWTQHRTIEQARAAIRASSVVLTAVDHEADELAGFTRVLTDGVFVAVILDVMVAAQWRGLGAGALLMDAITAHPVLHDVESLELVCQPDLVPFYARWGFTDQVGSSRLMRRTEREALVSPSRH